MRLMSINNSMKATYICQLPNCKAPLRKKENEAPPLLEEKRGNHVQYPGKINLDQTQDLMFYINP